MTISKTRFYKILGKAHFKKAAEREDGLITYQPSSDTIVSQQRTTEREAFQSASGRVDPPATNNGGYDANKRKKCTNPDCSNPFQPYKNFTKITKRNGLIIYHSWCNGCRAEWARLQYQEAKSLSRFP